MELRLEFTRLASVEGANRALLCRRFGISRKTGYKWLARHAAAGAAGLREQPRRPRSSPRRTAEPIESLLTATRRAHPAWGARKLRAFLERQGQADFKDVLARSKTFVDELRSVLASRT